MLVKDTMTREPVCVSPGATLQQASVVMRDSKVGMLPVCENGRPVGVVTDRDIVTRAVAPGFDPTMHLVREVMTPHVIQCFEDQPVEVAARIMENNDVRRLVVVDGEKHVVGVLTTNDLATLPTTEGISSEEFLDHIVHPRA